MSVLAILLIVLSAFLVLFPLIWIGVCFLISTLGGWGRLATYYRDEGVREGAQTFTFHTAYIGLSRYKNCLTYELFDEGMRISTWPIFRFGHPPLFIAWSEFHDVVERKRGYYAANIGRPTVCHVVLQVNLRAFLTRSDVEPPVVA